MKIKIQYMNESIDIIDFDENKSVLELKKIIADKNESVVNCIKLIFSGKILNNNQILNSYKVDDEQPIICFIKDISHANDINNEEIPENNSSNDLPNLFNSFFSGLASGNGQNLISSIMNSVNLPSNSQVRSSFNNMNNNSGSSNNEIHTMEFVYNNSGSDNPTVQFTYNNTANPTSTVSESYNLNQHDDESSLNSQNEEIPMAVECNNQNEESLNENASIAAEKTLDFDELRKKYVAQLNEIKAMGFEDENKILKKLALSRGSVSITINKLLSD